MLRNAVRGGVSNLPEKNITKVYGSTLLFIIIIIIVYLNTIKSGTTAPFMGVYMYQDKSNI